MTKEQIIKKHLEVSLSGSVVETFFAYKAAMDEWAKRQAITFLEWASNEGYQNYDSHESWIAPHNNLNVYSTERLFQLFLQSQNKEQ